MPANEYNIPVSEFAKLCGTTRDTLRHYYETGILIPHIDSANGYHYYAASQVSSFFFINCFRRTGCSVKEISDLIHHTDCNLVHSILANQIGNLKTELNELHAQIDSLAVLLRILDYHDKYNVQHPNVYTIPKVSVIRTAIFNKDEAVSLSYVAEDVTRHIAYISEHTHMPPYPLGATITIDDLRAHNYVYNEIITLVATKSTRKKIIQLPSTKVVGCFHEDSTKDITCTYDMILKYIDDHNLTPVSDLFSISIFNIYQNEGEHTYLKCLFVCVE